MTTNKDTQEEELCALKSIFDEEFEVYEDGEKMGGKYFAQVDIPSDFKIMWEDGKDTREISVQFLPPIVLSFILPENYPSSCPPTFTLGCDWMTSNEIANLCVKLFELWNEDKDVILFKWASFLKDESLTFLNIFGKLDVTSLLNQSKNIEEQSNAVSSVGTSHVQPDTKGIAHEKHNDLTIKKKFDQSKSRLLLMIQEHNKQKLLEVFNKEMFTCSVCLITAAGSKCIQFQPCHHVFCKRCVKEYIEVAIKEGRVQNMACLEMDCKSPVLQAHVKELVSSEQFASYDKVLLNVSLTSMSDVMFCPFASCETPVLFDPEDNMASCPVCHYVFCIFCKMGYHGVEPCRIKTRDKAKLVREYLSATGSQKRDIERRYGKRPLQALVNNVMSQEWIDANSKACPHCGAHIEKFDGCNKMQCWRCGNNFCWLCGKLLKDPNPYEHFRSARSQCNGMLFHGLPAEAYEFNEEEFVDNVQEISDDDDEDDYIYFQMAH